MTSSVVQCRRCPRRLTVKYVEWRDGLLLCATCAAEVDGQRGECDSCGRKTELLLHTCSTYGCGDFCPNCDGREGVA